VSTPSPVVGGLAFTSISVGSVHACGILVNQSIACWGLNSANRCQITSPCTGTPPSIGYPVATPLYAPMLAADIYTGYHFSCLITTQGALYCWGYGGLGTFCNGLTVDVGTGPTLVMTSYTWASFARGGQINNQAMCAVTTDGLVLCCGNGAAYKLGTGSPSSSNFPVAPAFRPPTAVSGYVAAAMNGASAACAIHPTAGVACWGDDGARNVGAAPPTLIEQFAAPVSPSASPTPSPSVTPTRSVTNTRSPTTSPSQTATQTQTTSQTPSRSPSFSPTPSA
jgi:hypothetical protein